MTETSSYLDFEFMLAKSKLQPAYPSSKTYHLFH